MRNLTQLARARAMHKQAPLIDGHNDYPWALRGLDPGRDFGKADITKPVPSLMTDIPRLRQGGVGGAVLVGVRAVDDAGQGGRPRHARADRHRPSHDEAVAARRSRSPTPPRDVERSFKAGRIGSLIGMEGGHSIDNSLATLRMMYALGARYMTLTHSANLPWADASPGPAGARRPVEVRRRGGARDEPPRHAGRSQPRLARHDGGRAARHRGAGDLLALVGQGDLQRAIATCPTTCCSWCRRTAAW